MEHEFSSKDSPNSWDSAQSSKSCDSGDTNWNFPPTTAHIQPQRTPNYPIHQMFDLGI